MTELSEAISLELPGGHKDEKPTPREAKPKDEERAEQKDRGNHLALMLLYAPLDQAEPEGKILPPLLGFSVTKANKLSQLRFGFWSIANQSPN